MDNDNHELRVPARSARLTADTADEDGPPWTFGGIAVAAGDILRMDDGTRILMTEEELRAAADTLEGEPLTKDHPRDEDGNPIYPPPFDEKYGEVERSGWVDDQNGVGYLAATDDEKIKSASENEYLEVSIHPTFDIGESDPETGAHVARNIDFRDLSVVSKGDSPSNTATASWDANYALASWTESADLEAELTAAEGSEDADQRPVVRETVHGVLSALGLSSEELQAQAEAAAEESEGEEQSADESAESDSDTETEMTEQESESESDGQESETEPDEGEETEDETSEELEQLKQRIDTLETELAAQQSGKADKVDEIIAESDEYDEDDREELMASADGLIDSEHDRLTGQPASQLPASGGLTAQAPSPAGLDDEDDLDDVAIGLADYEAED